MASQGLLGPIDKRKGNDVDSSPGEMRTEILLPMTGVDKGIYRPISGLDHVGLKSYLQQLLALCESGASDSNGLVVRSGDGGSQRLDITFSITRYYITR